MPTAQVAWQVMTHNGFGGNDFLYGGDLQDTLDGVPGIDFCYRQSGVDTYKNCEFRIDIDDGEVVRF